MDTYFVHRTNRPYNNNIYLKKDLLLMNREVKAKIKI